MKLSLLIFCLVCVCVITAQRPDKECIQCLRANIDMCYPCLDPCADGPPLACQNFVKIMCEPCVAACSEYEGFNEVETDPQTVTFHNTFSQAVNVNFTCFGQTKGIQPKKDKDFSCIIETIDASYVDPSNKKTVICKSYTGTPTFHPKFDIEVDRSKPGGCQVVSAIGAESDNNTAMDITPQSTQSTGTVTVTNNLIFGAKTFVKCSSMYDINIQVGDIHVSQCVVEKISAYYTTDGGKVTVQCESFIGGGTYLPEFAIRDIGGGKCKVFLA